MNLVVTRAMRCPMATRVDPPWAGGDRVRSRSRTGMAWRPRSSSACSRPYFTTSARQGHQSRPRDGSTASFRMRGDMHRALRTGKGTVFRVTLPPRAGTEATSERATTAKRVVDLSRRRRCSSPATERMLRAPAMTYQGRRTEALALGGAMRWSTCCSHRHVSPACRAAIWRRDEARAPAPARVHVRVPPWTRSPRWQFIGKPFDRKRRSSRRSTRWSRSARSCESSLVRGQQAGPGDGMNRRRSRSRTASRIGRQIARPELVLAMIVPPRPAKLTDVTRGGTDCRWQARSPCGPPSTKTFTD